MEKKFKSFRLLIFALSVLMSFCLVYPQNDSWGEIRFLSPNLALGSFETADQEDLVLDPPDQSKGTVSASFVSLSHLGIHSLQNFFPFSSQPFFPDHKPSILRC